MNSDKFGAALRQLNYTHRWSTVPMNRPNSTSQHSFWVVVYCWILTDELVRMSGVPFDGLDQMRVMRFATFHDVGELVTGDILGPAKRSFIDRYKMTEYERRSTEQLGIRQFWIDGQPYDTQYKNIIKAADIIDDVMVLSEEMALGNRKVDGLFKLVAKRLKRVLDKLNLSHLFIAVMDAADAVQTQHHQIIQNDSDIEIKDPDT